MSDWTSDPNPDPIADIRKMAARIAGDAGPSLPCGHPDYPHLVSYMTFDRGGLARCVKCGVTVEVAPSGEVVRRG